MGNSRIYIASPLKSRQFNEAIAKVLRENDLDYFLPQSLGMHDSPKTIHFIGEFTYSEIQKSRYLLVLYPFGLSTAAEIGFAVNLKKNMHPISIILLNVSDETPRLDANITPFYDSILNSFGEFMDWISTLKKTYK